MPREASSQSSAIPGPGPSTIASRSGSASTSSASASASRSSSTRSSPANDLFRISLPDHTDGFFGPSALENIRKRFAEAGSARFQDILQEASLALKARFASLDVSDSPLSEKEKKRLFDEFMNEMRQIAELQEREVEARTHEEAVFAKTLIISRSENTSGTSGTSSGGGSAVSSSSASGSSSSRVSATGGSSSGFSSVSSSSSSTASMQAASVKDADDGSSTEEETDRPAAAKAAKSKGTKGTKPKAGKLPPSLNTSSNNDTKQKLITPKKGVSKDDDALSSSPSTPTPARRGRSGTISLPRSVSASSAFADDSASLSSASSHNKGRSSDSASASVDPKEGAVEGGKAKTKGANKSASGSPSVNTRSELLAGPGSSSSSITSSKSVTTKNATASQNQHPHQKPAQTQQRGPTVASMPVVHPPTVSTTNSSTKVHTTANTNTGPNNTKKGVAQQSSDNNLNSNNSVAALKSPPSQSQTFQLAQTHLQHAHQPHPSQAQANSQVHSQNKKGMTVTTTQDDSILGNRTNKENSTNASHKVWIPPKPPHMQSPASVNTKEASTSLKELSKDAKEPKEGKESKDGGKEKKTRPVSLASQGVGALNLTTSPTANAKEVPTPVPTPGSVSAPTTEKAENGLHNGEGGKAGGRKKGAITEKESEKKASLGSFVPASASSTATQAQNSASMAAKASPATESVSRDITGATKDESQAPPTSVFTSDHALDHGAGNAKTSPQQVNTPAITSAAASSVINRTEKKAGIVTASPQSNVVSVPPTPITSASGLSSASSSEAAAAEIERERLRMEKEWAMIGIGRDGRPQFQSPASLIMPQPYPYAQSATHAHTHVPVQPGHQKVVSADNTSSAYTHPSPFAHTSVITSVPSGTAGMMSPSVSGSTTSTITSQFSPLSMANGFPMSSSATSAASSRAISRHASSSSSDPHAQKDGYGHLHAHHQQHHGHGHGKREKDKLAEAAAALMIGPQPPTQANMFWQPASNERERGGDRNHGRNPSTNNNASHSSSASASAASSRSSSVSRHDGFGGFDPSTIRPASGRPGQSPLLQAAGLGLGNAGIEAFASFLEGGSTEKSSHAAKAGLGTKIWTPTSGAKESTPKPSRRSEREANSSASSPPVHPLSLTLSSFSSSSSTSTSLVPSTGSTVPNASTSQAHFYAVAERAREERLRVRASEFRNRAEVVAVFQRRVEELMSEFAEALMQADEYEKFDPSSTELTKPGSD